MKLTDECMRKKDFDCLHDYTCRLYKRCKILEEKNDSLKDEIKVLKERKEDLEKQTKKLLEIIENDFDVDDQNFLRIKGINF